MEAHRTATPEKLKTFFLVLMHLFPTPAVATQKNIFLIFNTYTFFLEVLWRRR